MTGQVIAVDGGHTIRKGPNLVPLFCAQDSRCKFKLSENRNGAS